MPKLKTHKGTAKRIKITGSGKESTCQCRRHGFYCPQDLTWGGAAKLCATTGACALEPVRRNS